MFCVTILPHNNDRKFLGGGLVVRLLIYILLDLPVPVIDLQSFKNICISVFLVLVWCQDQACVRLNAIIGRRGEANKVMMMLTSVIARAECTRIVICTRYVTLQVQQYIPGTLHNHPTRKQKKQGTLSDGKRNNNTVVIKYFQV